MLSQTFLTTDTHPFWVVADTPDDLRRARESVTVETARDGPLNLYHANIDASNGGYYVEASDLRLGDVFQGPHGELTTLIATSREEHPEGISVYNIEVDGTSNYYVIANYEACLAGAEPTLVHNSRRCLKTDHVTGSTVNSSQYFRSEGEARHFAMRMLGKNPIRLPDNKIRSQNGKWQYRAKPSDVNGLHGNGSHVHLEELNPKTNEVIRNIHLYFKQLR